MFLSRSLDFKEKETKAIFLTEGFFNRTRNKVGRLSGTKTLPTFTTDSGGISYPPDSLASWSLLLSPIYYGPALQHSRSLSAQTPRLGVQDSRNAAVWSNMSLAFFGQHSHFSVPNRQHVNMFPKGSQKGRALRALRTCMRLCARLTWPSDLAACGSAHQNKEFLCQSKKSVWTTHIDVIYYPWFWKKNIFVPIQNEFCWIYISVKYPTPTRHGSSACDAKRCWWTLLDGLRCCVFRTWNEAFLEMGGT